MAKEKAFNKRLFVVMMVMAGIMAYADTPTITGVTAQQRYPWNGKVDITYAVTGDIVEKAKQRDEVVLLKVSATDMDANATYVATQLSGDLSMEDGKHAVVWDMNADGLTFKSSNVAFKVAYETTNALYCVIDLATGAGASSYPVTYLIEPPIGGFNVDEYKTTKFVLRRIEAGTFIMGEDQNDESHRVILTKPFFCGLFEVTQKQYSLVTGWNPSYYSGDTLPVDKVTYTDIRGSSSVNSASFLGKLRARTGLDFDLPTEAQWEYACRAGTTTTYSNGNSANGSYMWYYNNSSSTPHTVGLKSANPWGLYDMHGNVWEWCLDWSDALAYGTDPRGSSSGKYRELRGGSWSRSTSECTSFYRLYGRSPSSTEIDIGFRIVRTLSR